jgi:hypothetical protein
MPVTKKTPTPILTNFAFITAILCEIETEETGCAIRPSVIARQTKSAEMGEATRRHGAYVVRLVEIEARYFAFLELLLLSERKNWGKSHRSRKIMGNAD